MRRKRLILRDRLRVPQPTRPSEIRTMRCILALDQGTTSSRAIVFDETGAIRGSAQQ